jgi:hypothetical protein
MTDKKRKTIKIERTVADKAKAYCKQNHIIYEKWCTEAVQEKLNKTPKG